MNKTTNTILIMIGAIILLCGCGTAIIFGAGLWSFGRFVNWDEQNVSEGPEIVDYEIPDGFGSPYSAHLGDMTIVSYTSQDEKSQILLAQFPEGTSINSDELLRQMSEATHDPTSVWHNTKMTLVEEMPVTIREQECTLSISEGISADGITYRSATVDFEGRGGPAAVLIVSTADEWDIEMVQTFIASIE